DGTDSFGIYTVDYQGNQTEILSANSFSSANGFISNMSRLGWGYSSDGGTNNYLMFSAWHYYNGQWRSNIFRIKDDGSQKDFTPNDYFSGNQTLYSKSSTTRITSADVINGSETIVYVYGSSLAAHRELRVSDGANTYTLTSAGIALESGNYYSYFLGQPKFSPDGSKIAFVIFKWDSVGSNSDRDIYISDIYVINDWRGVVSSGSKIASRTDSRMTKLTNSDRFCWNPSWNTDGDVVTWSQVDSGTFNFRTYYNEPGKTVGDYVQELKNADFATYMRYVDSAGNSPYDAQQLTSVEEGENHYSFDWSNAGDTIIAIMKNSSGFKIKYMHQAEESVIYDSGGILFDNGKTVLVVPANSIRAANTKIGIKDVSPSAITGTADTTKIILSGTAREFYPEGMTFDEQNPAKLVLYYNLTDLGNCTESINSRFGTNFQTGAELNGTPYEYQLNIYWYNPSTTSWENYSGTVDPTDNTTAGYYGRIIT
ncbi:MAG TPA: hypothetical protein PKY81_18100, partial [bacterium]|nr:hypothetical protein [bacterium]